MSPEKEPSTKRKKATNREESCSNCGEAGPEEGISCPQCGRAMCEKCVEMGPCAMCQFEKAQYGGKDEEDVWEAVGDELEGWVTDDEWV